MPTTNPQHAHPITPTPAAPAHFDYISAAASAKVSPDQLQSLIRLFEADYPHDLMLRELHILRACHAIARGTSTIQTILSNRADRAA